MTKKFKEWITVRTAKNRPQVNLGKINGRLYSVPGDRKAEVTVPGTKLTKNYIADRRLIPVGREKNTNPLSNPDLKQQRAENQEEEEKDGEVDDSNTVEEIKAWLDKEGVEYKTNQTKAELLDLVRNT